MKIQFIIIYLLLISRVESRELEAILKIFGDPEKREVSLNQPIPLKVSFIKPNNQKNHKMFMKMHAKPMHMLIIKSDGQSFAHIHPNFNPKTGEFSLNLNDQTRDPDNFSLPKAIPYKGNYTIFTEIMPMFPGEEGQMQMNRFHVKALDGPEVNKKNEQFPDARNKISVYLNENGKSTKVLSEARYMAKMHYQQFDFCDRYLPKFYFEVFEKNHLGQFERPKKFDNWLNMGGHSIILENPQDPEARPKFYHLHAFLPMAVDGEFTFPYHDHKNSFMPGQYRIWGQVKLKGKVLTFTTSFTYTLPEQWPRNC